MMSVLDSPTINSEVADAILSNLRNAIGPLKVSEATKGIRKPKKITAADFKKGVRTFLEEQVQRGLVFRHSSGKGGIERFWHRDEKHLLQERSVELARTPRTLGDLKKTLGKEVKGVDGAFVEAVIRELVGDDQLFEHPAATKKGSPRFAVTPPPPTVPPLDEPKQKAATDKLVTAARKILDASKVPPEDLLRVLRERLSQPGVSGTTHGEVTSQQKSIASHTNCTF